jgi:uncharacterized membrane protein YdjX (TVP38/TMEM64 family)
MEWIAPAIIWLASMGPWAPLLFVLAYVAASIVMAPAFLLAFAAGAVFGVWRGTLIIFAGAVAGSSAVYLMAKQLARTRLLRWMDRDPRVSSVRSVVSRQSLWTMFLLRLSPVVPYVLLNYTLALGGVRYRDFVVASVGMIPTIVMYVYYGKVVGDVAKVAAGVAPPRGLEYYVVLSVGLVATILATRTIARAAKRAIARDTSPE